MKYINYLLIVLFLAGFAACDKQEDPAPVTNTGNNNGGGNGNGNSDSTKQLFEVTGLTGVTLVPDDSATLAIGIEHKSGDQGQVSLSIKDMPANVTYSFSAQNGTPSFASVLDIKSSGAAGGDYTPSLVVTPEKGEAKSYPFSLKIDASEPTDCLDMAVGTYNKTGTGCGSSYEFTVSKDPQFKGQLIIKAGSAGMGPSVPPGSIIYAYIENCDTKKIIIPETPIGGGGSTIKGDGKILGNKKIELSFSGCTDTFTGQ